MTTFHSSDVIMSSMAPQITGVWMVYSTICSDQRKHQSSVSLAFLRGIPRWSVNSPHKGPVTRKMFLFDDIIMYDYRAILLKYTCVQQCAVLWQRDSNAELQCVIYWEPGQLLNKQPHCRWFEMLWRSYDVTVICHDDSMTIIGIT